MLAVAAAGLGATLALGGCSLLGSSKNAAATATSAPAAAADPSASPSSYTPLSGPLEAAGALPKDCSDMLSTAQLQNVFGAGVPIGTDYGAYAALGSIGRTGRVACVFGVGLDSFGQQSSGAVEISMSTYLSASDAVGRAATTVQQDSAAGATTAQVAVGGHPATIVVEAAATPTSAPASATATTTTTAAPSASAGATASAEAGESAQGETELVMADGNRTFVLQIPISQLNPSQAATALNQLALFVYQDTLPPANPATAHASATG